MNNAVLLAVIFLVVMIFIAGIRIVRPTHRGLIERLGKYNRFAMQIGRAHV